MFEERGVIKNKERQRQIHSFSGLKRLRNITPTDIDGLIDYGGKHFIYLEGKVSGNELFYGQKLALENCVKSHWASGHKSIAVVYEHWIPPQYDIDVSKCVVTKIFTMNEKTQEFYWWESKGSEYTVLEIVDLFEKQNKIA